MQNIIQVEDLCKTYKGGFNALKSVKLDIRRGEIFALLGPNGAGKTTLISIICGIVNSSSGRVLVDGHDVVSNYRNARKCIGLVPQELCTDAFESVWNTVSFSRGLFGKAPNPKHIETVLKQLSLWEKKDAKIMSLSGGMKRRVMIAKALSHEPRVLFLDEPTAGVDVSLRRDMWDMVRALRKNGVTIILTTHYIEEAEEMADRIGIINNGLLMLVEDKSSLMHKLGKKNLSLQLKDPLSVLPETLSEFIAGDDTHQLELSDDGYSLTYIFDAQKNHASVSGFLRRIDGLGIEYRDLNSQQSSLEDIFVSLVKEDV